MRWLGAILPHRNDSQGQQNSKTGDHKACNLVKLVDVLAPQQFGAGNKQPIENELALQVTAREQGQPYHCCQTTPENVHCHAAFNFATEREGLLRRTPATVVGRR
jgi:hypothetical protein